jgi:hypothetical protein
MSDLSRYDSGVAVRVPEEALGLTHPGEWLREHHRYHAVPLAPRRSLDGVRALLEKAMSDFAAGDAQADADLAIPLHEALQLTRREAADRRLWAWLGLAAFPEYVAHRWLPSRKTGKRTSTRFSGDRVRQTFSRLWWAVELTKSPTGGYDLTGQLLSMPGFQDVNEAIFGRAFCGYYPAMEAFIRVIDGAREKLVRQTAKEFSNVLSTMVLESMTETELRVLLWDLKDSVEQLQG